MDHGNDNLSDSLNDSLEADPHLKRLLYEARHPTHSVKSKNDSTPKKSVSQIKSSFHKRFLTQQDDLNQSPDENQQDELEDYLDSCRKINKKSPAKETSKQGSTANKRKYVSIQDYLLPNHSQTSYKLTYSSDKKSPENRKFNSRFVTFQGEGISEDDRYRIALQQIRKGNFQQAIRTLDEFPQTQPYKDYLYACAYFEMKDTDNFLAHANQLLKETKDASYMVHTYQMMAATHVNDPDKQIECIQAAVRLAQGAQLRTLKFQLAQMLFSAGYLEDASRIYREDGSLEAVHQLFTICFKSRQMEECLAYSQQLIKMEQDEKKLEHVYEGLAQLHCEVNKKKEAIDYLEKALKIKIEKYGWKNEKICVCAMNLGKLYSETKQYEKAKEKIAVGMQLISQINGIYNQTYGKCKIWLGENYFKLREYKLCMSSYQDGFEVYKQVLGPHHEFTLRVLLNMVYVGMKSGEDISEQMRQIVTSCLEEGGRLGGRILNELGNTVSRRQRVEEAIEIYKISLQRERCQRRMVSRRRR